MKLNDVAPQLPEFKLNNKVYKMRLLDLDDIAYFEDKYGSLEKLIEVISAEGKYRDKCSIIFAQIEDKSDFVEAEIEEINREGKKVKRTMTGPERFLKAIKLSEIYEPLNAFVKALERSTPDQNKEPKKKQIKGKKQTGR